MLFFQSIPAPPSLTPTPGPAATLVASSSAAASPGPAAASAALAGEYAGIALGGAVILLGLFFLIRYYRFSENYRLREVDIESAKLEAQRAQSQASVVPFNRSESPAVFDPIVERPPATFDPDVVCQTCLSDFKPTDALVCSNGHALCGDCLTTFLGIELANLTLDQLRTRGDGIIFCPLRCGAIPISDQQIAALVDAPLFARYLARKTEPLLDDAARQQRVNYERLIDEARAQVPRPGDHSASARSPADVAAAREAVAFLLGALLKNSCPGCKIEVHREFKDACLHQTCPGCNARFCGWCLSIEHSAERCPHSLSPGSIFLQAEGQWALAMDARRLRLFNEHLATLRPAVLEDTLRELWAPPRPPAPAGSGPPPAEEIVRYNEAREAIAKMEKLGLTEPPPVERVDPFFRGTDTPAFQDAREAARAAHVLGNGGFATVYRGSCRATSLRPEDLTLPGIAGTRWVDVAVKVIKDNVTPERFNDEVTALKRVRGQPNLVNILYFCSTIDDRGHPWRAIVMLLVPGGTLRAALSAGDPAAGGPPPGPPLLAMGSWRARLGIASGLAQSIRLLHSQTPVLLHRDIKSENIFLSDGLLPVLGDFGLARPVNRPAPEAFGDLHNYDSMAQTHTQVVHATEGYMAPEIELQREFSKATDIYGANLVFDRFSSPSPSLRNSSPLLLFPPQHSALFCSSSSRVAAPWSEAQEQIANSVTGCFFKSVLEGRPVAPTAWPTAATTPLARESISRSRPTLMLSVGQDSGSTTSPLRQTQPLLCWGQPLSSAGHARSSGASWSSACSALTLLPTRGPSWRWISSPLCAGTFEPGRGLALTAPGVGSPLTRRARRTASSAKRRLPRTLRAAAA